MNRLLEGLVKLVLFILFAPFVLCLVLQAMLSVFAVVIPWLVLFSVVAGIAAGVSAGLIVRRRMPSGGRGEPLLPGGQLLGGHRVRRPRGSGWS